MAMMDGAREGRELYATSDTTEGRVVVRLFSKDAPETVRNFVGLATGEKEWTASPTSCRRTATTVRRRTSASTS